MSDRPSRRKFIALSGGLAATSLAGCLDGGGDESSPADESNAPTESGESTDAETQTPADETETATDSLSPVTVDESWKRHRYTRANTGASPNTAPEGKPTVRWDKNLGGGTEGPPVIADGTVYVGAYRAGAAFALDASSGETLWKKELGTAIDVSPTVAGDTVFFVMDNELYALDRESGEELWSVSENLAYDVPPLVVDGTVYLSESADNLHAYDAASGDELAQAPYEGNAGGSLAYADGTVFVNSSDAITAIDTSDHSQSWTKSIPGDSEYGAAVADGTVFVAGENLHAFDAASGEQQWQFDAIGNPSAVPAVRDGVVYAGGWGDNLYALDAADGTEQWSMEVTHLTFQSISAETLYVCRITPSVAALDPTSGDTLWTFEGEHSGSSSPVFASGLVFLPTGNGLTCLQVPE